MSDSQDTTDFDDATPYSPAGFEAPEPELNDNHVTCAGCGEIKPVSEMGVTTDEVTKNEVGDVLAVTRYYLCNSNECRSAFMKKI